MSAPSSFSRSERARRAMLGLAAGDAVGTTVEFSPPGTFEPVRDMVGGGPFNLRAGEWTDDTSMSLCLAESLLACRAFDPTDQLERYRRWWREGHLSHTGECFDIGNTTVAALGEFERSGDPYPGRANPTGAGNGGLMRLAPIPICAETLPHSQRLAQLSSETTHGAPQASAAAWLLGGILYQALSGEPIEELLQPTRLEHFAHPSLATEEIEPILCGSYTKAEGIRGSGYVIRSLEAALWAVWGAQDFQAAILRAVNLGDDADTTAAIAGQLAGAAGWEIPEEWRARLIWGDRIAQLGAELSNLKLRAPVDRSG